jgi:hypothetical protein
MSQDTEGGTRPACYSLDEFCDAHRISRAMYYKLDKLGQAPSIIRVGNKVLITMESAARWRAEREMAQSLIG